MDCRRGLQEPGGLGHAGRVTKECNFWGEIYGEMMSNHVIKGSSDFPRNFETKPCED